MNEHYGVAAAPSHPVAKQESCSREYAQEAIQDSFSERRVLSLPGTAPLELSVAAIAGNAADRGSPVNRCSRSSLFIVIL